MKKEELVYGPLALPSGMKVKFREARGIDRSNVMIMQKELIKEGNVIGQIMVDSYVSAKCIVEIDGETPAQSYKGIYEDMSEADLDFYESVRREMFAMTKDKQEEAKKQAAFLLGNQTSTDTSNSQNTQKR